MKQVVTDQTFCLLNAMPVVKFFGKFVIKIKIESLKEINI